MKYSLAFATAALATGAVAGPHRLAHQHKAREAEPYVITYTAGQCFGAGDCVPSWSTPPPVTVGGPATEAAPAATQVVTHVAAAPAAQVTHEASHAVAQLKEAVAPSSSSSGSGNEDSGSADISSGFESVGNAVGSIAGSVMSELTSVASKSGMLGVQPDNTCQVGSGKNNQMTVSNQSGKDLVWVCWSNGQHQWVNKFAPAIFHGIKSGAKETFSFDNTPQYQQGGGCAPWFAHSFMTNGQINDTMMEFTWNSYGTIDVSKEINPSGTVMSMTTQQGCKSDMNTCVYQCHPDALSADGHCGDANSYSIINCSGPGANPSSDGANGGCQAGANANVQVVVG